MALTLPQPKRQYEDDTTLNGEGSSYHREYRDDPSTESGRTHNCVITIEMDERQGATRPLTATMLQTAFFVGSSWVIIMGSPKPTRCSCRV